jgi:hypothetical protein
MGTTIREKRIQSRGSAAVKKEKIKMDNVRYVEKLFSVLDTSKCDSLNSSDRVPARVLFKYERGSCAGGFSLTSSSIGEEAGRKILSWLRANADPDQFCCGLQSFE